MPTYEYICDTCSKRFETEKGINDNSETAFCEECKGIGKKVPSLSAFHLKGGGWYKDRYQKPAVKKG